VQPDIVNGMVHVKVGQDKGQLQLPTNSKVTSISARPLERVWNDRSKSKYSHCIDSDSCNRQHRVTALD
jgi:hypothetical protein